MTLRQLACGLLVCVLGVTLAEARKPSRAHALATAKRFLSELAEDGAAAPLAGRTLEVLVREETVDEPRCAGTGRTPADKAKLLACLASQDLAAPELVPFTHRARARLAGPLVTARTRLARLERTATLVTHHAPCVGQGADVIVAVALEDDQPRVVAVFAQSYSCGE